MTLCLRTNIMRDSIWFAAGVLGRVVFFMCAMQKQARVAESLNADSGICVGRNPGLFTTCAMTNEQCRLPFPRLRVIEM